MAEQDVLNAIQALSDKIDAFTEQFSIEDGKIEWTSANTPTACPGVNEGQGEG